MLSPMSNTFSCLLCISALAKEQVRSDWNEGKGKFSSEPTLVRTHYWANFVVVIKVKIFVSFTNAYLQYHYWNFLRSGSGTWGIQLSEKSKLQQLTETCWVNTSKANYFIKLIILRLCNSDTWICKSIQGPLSFLESPYSYQ